MTEMIAKVHKADPLSSALLEGKIKITKQLPITLTLPEALILYKKDAKEIFRVLKECLPQGTRYELAKLILSETPNLYRGV